MTRSRCEWLLHGACEASHAVRHGLKAMRSESPCAQAASETAAALRSFLNGVCKAKPRAAATWIANTRKSICDKEANEKTKQSPALRISSLVNPRL